LFGRRDHGAGGAREAALELDVSNHVARLRATIYFLWLIGFVVLIALIGFIPAITVFIVAYMRLGFGEPWPHALGYGAATVLACWIVFDRTLGVTWPHSLLGDLLPALRAATGFI